MYDIYSDFHYTSGYRTDGGGGTIVANESIIQGVTLYINGYEWGPAVSRLILNTTQLVLAVDYEQALVKTNDVERTILAAYPSDSKGQKLGADQDSRYVTLELSTQYLTKAPGNKALPFQLDTETGFFNWAPTYIVSITDLIFTAANNYQSLKGEIRVNAIENRVSPDTDLFKIRNSFSGEYINPTTKQLEQQRLTYAAYEPENLKPVDLLPLIVWLHGAGEGGTDVEIALLGNETTALAKPEIQDQFQNGLRSGAHVLVVQTPTFWMDEGENRTGPGAGKSRYTEILMDTIRHYVDSNDNIDSHRIYLGGCSNGGYMTVNMLLEYPQTFAAAYPVCEAYSFYGFERDKNGSYETTTDSFGNIRYKASEALCLTEDRIRQLADEAIWFVHAANDRTVVPFLTVEPTYRRILKQGAQNVWFSYFETVVGLDEVDEKYNGHLSWIYLFNNQVRGVQNPTKIRQDNRYEPSNDTLGGSYKVIDDTDGVEEFETIFAWLNEQRL
ncbi:prolyl oligopeptidase family serine peptidase [Fundicoccus sp. Sow4_D5]|uniref:prolyl oligopeptidase family serine peptidase n=1 Tax=Fundicoccus sp. Sow4_D5 TaxID=3438782 RepID=UPI003F918603